MFEEPYIYLSKLLPLLILPIWGVVFFCFGALFFVLRTRYKAAAIFQSISLFLLLVSSMPAVSAYLYGKLEQQFPPVALQDIPVRGCMVLLGGITSAARSPRVEIELNEAIDRAYMATKLFKSAKSRMVIVSAGNQPWMHKTRSEAELIRVVLEDWGVDRSAIFLDGSSRNTRENAINSKALMLELGCESALLVTSGAHMHRAMAAFQRLGVDVFPVSTDIRVADSDSYTLMDFLPQAGALAMTTDAMREWLGQKAYEARGWN